MWTGILHLNNGEKMTSRDFDERMLEKSGIIFLIFISQMTLYKMMRNNYKIVLVIVQVGLVILMG